jgi:hypothetical protein
MDEAEYRRRRAALVDDADATKREWLQKRRRIGALDLVWTEVLNSPGSVPAAPDESATDLGPPPNPFEGVELDEYPARTLARDAALNLTGDFSIRDVQRAVRDRNPDFTEADLDRMRPTISATLKNMCSEEELELVREGSGRRPHIYRLRRASPPTTT